MARKRKKEKKKKKEKKPTIERSEKFSLPEEIKQRIVGILVILLAIIISLGFFDMAGKAGSAFVKVGYFLIGNSIFSIPLILFLAGAAFLNVKARKKLFDENKAFFWSIILGIIILSLSISGILGTFSPELKKGGWIGYFLSWPFLNYFGVLASRIIFLGLIFIGFLIIWHFLSPLKEKEETEEDMKKNDVLLPEKNQSIIKKIFQPKFKVEEVSSESKKDKKTKNELLSDSSSLKLDLKPVVSPSIFSYNPPPLDFLEKDRGLPTSGDIKANSEIIRKTLHDFKIEVTMSEVNVGPTVTQYTLKPAEGIKLSKITNLTNNLSLALASHPIRIEAPIPGRPLVGIEVPNKIRADVRLRNLLRTPNFQKSPEGLLIALGRDVAGSPAYADLTKMPHLLVAGSTGSGKTIFLNSLILSLLYQPNIHNRSASPERLRLILVDPKRVELSVYSSLPHLLCPTLYTASETINALKWLIGEMERRFSILSKVNARDINSYNEKALKGKIDPLPLIVFIVDELAELMVTKGKEIETGIVRLAQMSRAVGIHLVVATQRPSVEVITGLIKANITSRVAFKVASQVDSRTVLDTSGAEKLLGRGDMLFISASTSKPKRIQAPYVSEREVKKVVDYIIDKAKESEMMPEMDETLLETLKHSEEEENNFGGDFFDDGGDPLFQEAKRLVLETKKASASFLQRRLRVGYARAARLIDMLEKEGVVGPAEGAKPREVFGDNSLREEEKIPGEDFLKLESDKLETKEDDDWKKV